MPLYMVEHSSAEQAHRLRKKLKPQHIRYIINGGKSELVFVADDHHVGTWVDKMKDQFHCRFRPAPDEYVGMDFTNLPTSPCGEEFTTERSMNSHRNRCSSCVTLRPTSASQNGKVETVSPPIGAELSIQGMIDLFHSRANECMTLAGRYEEAGNALVGLATIDARKREIEEEEASHRQALTYLLKES